MSDFLIRLLIVVLILWLIQTILGYVGLGEPSSKILFGISLIVGILWLLFGYIGLGVR